MHSPHTSVSVFGLEDPPVCPIALQLVVEDPLMVGVPLEPLGIISGATSEWSYVAVTMPECQPAAGRTVGINPNTPARWRRRTRYPASPASADYRGGCVEDRSYRSGTVKSAVRR
jgi:hypothetical protein